MIDIIETTKDEVFDLNEAEWDLVNDVHFGEGVRWNTKEFRYKAMEEGQVVGLLFGKHESGTIYISNIIVFKEKRRQGIGTKLIKKAEELGREYKDHKIWLISGEHYPEDPFFTAIGFKKEAFIPNLYFNKNFIVYTKSI